MKVCAVIVAGGRSSRMGQEKALLFVRGRSIVERIVAALEGQVAEILLNANGDPQRFGKTGLAVIGDIRGEIGTPLAGVHSALSYGSAHGYDAVLTVPSDVPFLPADLVARLAGAKGSAAIAASGGQGHYLTGLWSCSLLPEADAALNQPRVPRLQDWVQLCNAVVVEWSTTPFDPFFNVNTPEDLAEAERIAAEFAP